MNPVGVFVKKNQKDEPVPCPTDADGDNRAHAVAVLFFGFVLLSFFRFPFFTLPMEWAERMT